MALAFATLPATLASLAPLAALVPIEIAAPIRTWTASTLTFVLFDSASSAIGCALWLSALFRVDVPRVSACLDLSPVTAVALSAAFLGSALLPRDVAALALVVLGFATLAGIGRSSRPADANVGDGA